MDLVLGIGIGIIVTYILEQILQRNKALRNEFWEHHRPILGYHIHHSTLGIPFIIVGLMNPFNNGLGLLIVGVGIGIIVMHTITSKEFTFIEKSNKERKNKLASEK